MVIRVVTAQQCEKVLIDDLRRVTCWRYIYGLTIKKAQMYQTHTRLGEGQGDNGLKFSIGYRSATFLVDWEASLNSTNYLHWSMHVWVCVELPQVSYHFIPYLRGCAPPSGFFRLHLFLPMCLIPLNFFIILLHLLPPSQLWIISSSSRVGDSVILRRIDWWFLFHGPVNNRTCRRCLVYLHFNKKKNQVFYFCWLRIISISKWLRWAWKFIIGHFFSTYDDIRCE